ncbi:hypothetical protein ABK040_014444 [Willaertia magna]
MNEEIINIEELEETKQQQQLDYQSLPSHSPNVQQDVASKEEQTLKKLSSIKNDRRLARRPEGLRPTGERRRSSLLGLLFPYKEEDVSEEVTLPIPIVYWVIYIYRLFTDKEVKFSIGKLFLLFTSEKKQSKEKAHDMESEYVKSYLLHRRIQFLFGSIGLLFSILYSLIWSLVRFYQIAFSGKFEYLQPIVWYYSLAIALCIVILTVWLMSFIFYQLFMVEYCKKKKKKKLRKEKAKESARQAFFSDKESDHITIDMFGNEGKPQTFSLEKEESNNTPPQSPPLVHDSFRFPAVTNQSLNNVTKEENSGELPKTENNSNESLKKNENIDVTNNNLNEKDRELKKQNNHHKEWRHYYHVEWKMAFFIGFMMFFHALYSTVAFPRILLTVYLSESIYGEQLRGQVLNGIFLMSLLVASCIPIRVIFMIPIYLIYFGTYLIAYPIINFLDPELTKASKNTHVAHYLTNIVFVAVILMICLTKLFYQEYFYRKYFLFQKREKKRARIILKENERLKSLLKNLFPGPIVHEIRSNARVERIWLVDSVSILVCDIVGFTAFSASTSPMEFIKVLNTIFYNFDCVVERYSDFDKIKTIGDALLIAGGLSKAYPLQDNTEGSETDVNVLLQNENSRDLAKKSVKLGLELIKVLIYLNLKSGWTSPLSIRVGCTIGKSFIGIMGLNCVSFDLYGYSVRECYRLEQSSKPNTVHVSNAVHQLTKGALEYHFESNPNYVEHNFKSETYYINFSPIDTKEETPKVETSLSSLSNQIVDEEQIHDNVKMLIQDKFTGLASQGSSEENSSVDQTTSKYSIEEMSINMNVDEQSKEKDSNFSEQYAEPIEGLEQLISFLAKMKFRNMELNLNTSKLLVSFTSPITMMDCIRYNFKQLTSFIRFNRLLELIVFIILFVSIIITQSNYLRFQNIAFSGTGIVIATHAILLFLYATPLGVNINAVFLLDILHILSALMLTYLYLVDYYRKQLLVQTTRDETFVYTFDVPQQYQLTLLFFVICINICWKIVCVFWARVILSLFFAIFYVLLDHLILQAIYSHTSVPINGTTTIPFLFFTVCVFLYAEYFSDVLQLDVYRNRKKLLYIQQRLNIHKHINNGLMNSVFPRKFVDTLKRDPTTNVYTNLENVCVVFCQIVNPNLYKNKGFEESSIKFLNDCFKKMDEQLSTQVNCDKIKSTNDVYIFLSGFKHFQNSEATADSELACYKASRICIDMVYKFKKIVKEVKQEYGYENVNFRVGISYGTCFGGVVGKEKQIFDIFGDLVNLSSRLMSTQNEKEVRVCEKFVEIFNLRNKLLKKKEHNENLITEEIQLKEEDALLDYIDEEDENIDVKLNQIEFKSLGILYLKGKGNREIFKLKIHKDKFTDSTSQ